ncbi:ABC transporter ATP-binding protein [Spirochaetia bacterium]|nr:ABC transporter ATP-binding protein [Spirochaetia bacterium]
MQDEAPLFDVELNSVIKNYGSFRAVDNFSLSVKRGSFTTLLGPSGCGKTTLLRIIAGFYEPDSGSVIIAGKDQRGIPPEKRSTGIVFQDYALFPHMTVEENLAYGLRIRKIDPRTRKEEILKTADSLGLEDLLGRYPGELSGGQQQRLALGRAIILKPRILLMDEPLSNLDAKLRLRVREELKDIQRNLGITTVYVTHDQEEALSLSDYIAVMNKGCLEQAGTPQEVYNFPRTSFAADFTGPANFIGHEGKNYLVRPEWITLREPAATFAGQGRDTLTEPGKALFELTGTVAGADYFGRAMRVRVRLDSAVGGTAAPVTADIGYDLSGQDRFKAGTAVRVFVNTAREIESA